MKLKLILASIPLQLGVGKALDGFVYTLYWNIATLLWQADRLIFSGALLINGLRQWLVDNVLELIEFMINGIAPIAAALLFLAVGVLGLQVLGSRVVKRLPQWVNPERFILMAVLSVLFLGTPDVVVNALEDVRNMVLSIRAGDSLGSATAVFDTGAGGTPDEPLPTNIPDVLAVEPFDGVVDAFDLMAYYIHLENVAELDETTFPPEYAARWFPEGEPSGFDLSSEDERAEAIQLAADGILRLVFSLLGSAAVIAEQLLYLMLQAAAVILYLGLPLAFALSYFIFTQSLLTQYIRQFINLLLETLWSMIIAGFAIWLLVIAGSYGVMYFFFAAVIAAILLYWRVISAGLLLMRGFALMDGSNMTGGAGIGTLKGIATGVVTGGASLAVGAANRADDALKTTGQIGAAGGLYAAGRYSIGQGGRTDSPVRRQQAIQRGQQLQAAAGYVAGRNERMGRLIEGAHELRTMTRRVRGSNNTAADGLDYLRVGQMQSDYKSNPWLSIGMSSGLQKAYQQLGGQGGGRATSMTDPDSRLAMSGGNGTANGSRRTTTGQTGNNGSRPSTPPSSNRVRLEGLDAATTDPTTMPVNVTDVTTQQPVNELPQSSTDPSPSLENLVSTPDDQTNSNTGAERSDSPSSQPMDITQRQSAETTPPDDGSQQRETTAESVERSTQPANNPIPQLDIAAVRSVLEPDAIEETGAASQPATFSPDTSQSVQEANERSADSSRLVENESPPDGGSQTTINLEPASSTESRRNPFMPDGEPFPRMRNDWDGDPFVGINDGDGQRNEVAQSDGELAIVGQAGDAPNSAESNSLQSVETPTTQSISETATSPSIATDPPSQRPKTTPIPRSVPQAIAKLGSADPAVRTQARAQIAATAGTNAARQIDALTDKHGQPAVQETTQRLTNWLSRRQQQGASSAAMLQDLQRGAAWSDDTPLSSAEQATLAQAIVQPAQTVGRQNLAIAALEARAAGYDGNATAAWLGTSETLPADVTTQLNVLNNSADALGFSKREVLAVQADVEQYGTAATQAALIAEGNNAEAVSQLVGTLDTLPAQTNITPDLRFERGDVRGYQTARGEQIRPIQQGTAQIGDIRERATVLAQAVSGMSPQAAPAVQQMAQATTTRLTSAEDVQNIQKMTQRVGSDAPVKAAIQRIGEVATRYEHEDGMTPAAVVDSFATTDGEGMRDIERDLVETPLKRTELQQLAAATLQPKVILSRQELATAITQNAWQTDASPDTLAERLQVTDFGQQTAAVRVAATNLANSGLEATTVQQVIRDMESGNVTAAHDRLQKTKLPRLQTEKQRTAIITTLQQLPVTTRLRRRFAAPEIEEDGNEW